MRMRMLALIIASAIAAIALPPASLSAQAMKSLEFKNQEIRDILFVLAELNGVSIVVDETVTGKSSFYFSNMDFEAAFKLFVESNKLYYAKRDGIYHVSRIFAERDLATKLITVKCVDVSLRSLVAALSNAAGKTILFDQLPSDTITMQADALSLQEIVGIAVAKYRDLSVEVKDSYLYIRKKDQAGQAASSGGEGFFKTDGQRYSILVDRARFRDLALDLFKKAGKEVVFLMDQDLVLEYLNYKDKAFEDMLRLLLLKVGGDFTISDGVYYIMDVQKRDLQSKFLTTLVVPLQYISIQDFQRLMPASLASGSKMKADEKDNKLVLNGSLEELRPILDFVALVDTPKTNGSTVRIDLSYLRSDEAIPLLPSEFASFGPVSLPSKTGFVITLPPAKADKLRELVGMIDRVDPAVPITLNYIKADELLAALPPSVTDQNVKKTTDPRMVFFKGTEAMRKAFMRDLAAIDHPKPQLKYQVLVLALTDTDSDDWQAGMSVTNTESPQGGSLTKGEFKDLLGIGFDVISSFGLDFGLSLQWKIAKNKAQVLADTTLTSLSGEKITFKNTQTIRVKDTEVTGSTSATTTQIIREISSGLILNIEGWVSGGRMITMKVDTTLSEALTSDSAASLPKTAEKVVSSTARTEIGKPIVISGLKQRQATQDVKKVPILGDIPLLGLLFRSKNDSVTTVDYVISIVPRLELPEVNREALEREIVEGYYRYLFADGAAGRD
jgi:general secretion pathway protein D